MNYTSTDLYTYLSQSKWEILLDIESRHRNNIICDPIIKQIFDKYFIPALLDFNSSHKDKLYCFITTKNVYKKFLQHWDRTYSIPREKFEELVKELLILAEEQNEIKFAYTIAKKWEHIKESKRIIEYYNKHFTKEIIHSNENIVKLSENQAINTEKTLYPSI